MLFARMWSDVIRKGALTVTDARGRRCEFGDGSGAPAAVSLHDPLLPWKLLLHPRLALGEAFMDGRLTVDQGSVYDFLDILCRNFADSGFSRPFPARAVSAADRLLRPLHQFNPAGRAKRNAAHHYDLSGGLYDMFLDSGRQYSCAYFTEPHSDLERAQADKKRHIAAKLLTQPGHSVLDIGCGWGGLAVTLAREAGCRVTGLTLSQEQHAYARAKVRELGLEDRVDIRLEDYRLHRGLYDRIVSVGMFEHVGVRHYKTFFSQMRSMLKEDGAALLHTIGRLNGPGATDAWIRRYIFPGGYSPALSEVTPALERSGLMMTDVEIWRLHYARTLRLWRERFLARRDEARRLYDGRFTRMWEYYLAAGEAAFRHLGLAVFQIQMARRPDAVPLTRDYIAGFKFGGAEAAA